MFSKDEMDSMRRMIADGAAIEDIANAFGIHRVTLERRLLKHHHLLLEPTRGCRLVPLSERSVCDSPDHEDRDPLAIAA